jgi:hypothetical protein
MATSSRWGAESAQRNLTQVLSSLSVEKLDQLEEDSAFLICSFP